MSVEASLLHAWLEGRSIARGVAAPVADQGGFRVDTRNATEVCRWVFAADRPGLRLLGRTIRQPGYLLKLCGDVPTLRAALPDAWQVEGGTYVMQASGAPFDHSLPSRYRVTTASSGAGVQVRITTAAGDLAASGYGGETECAFVYDRIVTAPDHRRQGLGRVVMATLQASRRHADAPELLVATEDGRALYTALGWRTLSPYSTASYGPG